jgi:hypothetical protein
MWVVDTTVGINVLGGGSLVWCIRVVGVFGSEQIHFVRGTVVVCRFGREQFWFVRGPVCTFALQFSASFTVAS